MFFFKKKGNKKSTKGLKNTATSEKVLPLPQHVAIIMDGNGRWAKQRNLPRQAGHREGANTLEKIAQAAIDLGIRHLTVYAFSTENWSRSSEEVNGIMNLLREYLKMHIERAKSDDVRIHVIGDIRRLDVDIQRQIVDLEEMTSHKKGLTLHIALNYGSRDEILRAVRQIAAKVERGILRPAMIDENTIQDYLDTAGIPDPELLIRTGGNERLSNFLLWQCAYTEFYFSYEYWPDFTPELFADAVLQYQTRERRFGGRQE